MPTAWACDLYLDDTTEGCSTYADGVHVCTLDGDHTHQCHCGVTW